MDSIKVSQKLEGILEKTLFSLVELKVEILSLNCKELDGVNTILDSAIEEKCKGNIGRCFKMMWKSAATASNPDTLIIAMSICNKPGEPTSRCYRCFARDFVPSMKGLLAGKIYTPYTQNSEIEIKDNKIIWTNNLTSPVRVTEITRDEFFEIMSSTRRMEKGILDPIAGVLLKE